MNTTELLKDALDWADKRLKLLDEPITETQRHYIEFALRQNLVKNIGVTHCCESDSELLSCKCGLPKREQGIGFSCMRTDCDGNTTT